MRIYHFMCGYSLSKKQCLRDTWIILLIFQLAGGALTQITQEKPGNKDNVLYNDANTHINNKGNEKALQQQQQQQHSPNKTAANSNHPLQITFLTKRPVIFLDLDVKKRFQFNYTLQCDHPSTTFVVMAKIMTENIATIIEGNPVKISCKFGTILDHPNTKQTPQPDTLQPAGEQTAVENNPATIKQPSEGAKIGINEATQKKFEISGQFELRFESHMIGRSFFLMLANKISGPGAQKSPANERQNGNQSSGNHFGHGGMVQMGGEQQIQFANGSTAATGDDGGAAPASGGLPPNAVVKTMLIVMKLPTFIDKIFRILLYIVIITATIGMGIKVELDVVIKVMKKPMGPCIGLFCQYICMPLIAYMVAKTVPQPSAAISLGIFTCGIVPGGGASNFWCYLLNGDVTLSVTMTTISSIAALGLIPMWLFTLGANFKDETTDIKVPYPKILETLAIVLLPVFAGIIIKRKFPKVAKIISKILKPFLIFIVLFLLAVGIYANYFIFAMIRPMQILAGCLLPYVGYAIGGGIALLTCRTWEHVKTIAIETGIQNTGIAFMIVFFSFTPPDNQLASVAPAASSIMTPLPLIVVTTCYYIYLRFKKKGETEDATNDNKDESAKQMKDMSRYKPANIELTLWDRIRGKRLEKQTADKEEMLNQKKTVEKESFLS